MVSSKPRIQRKRAAQAPLHRKRRMTSSHLSPEIHDKAKGRMPRAVPVRKGDTVRVMRGGFRGRGDDVAQPVGQVAGIGQGRGIEAGHGGVGGRRRRGLGGGRRGRWRRGGRFGHGRGRLVGLVHRLPGPQPGRLGFHPLDGAGLARGLAPHRRGRFVGSGRRLGRGFSRRFVVAPHPGRQRLLARPGRAGRLFVGGAAAQGS